MRLRRMSVEAALSLRSGTDNRFSDGFDLTMINKIAATMATMRNVLSFIDFSFLSYV